MLPGRDVDQSRAIGPEGCEANGSTLSLECGHHIQDTRGTGIVTGAIVAAILRQPHPFLTPIIMTTLPALGRALGASFAIALAAAHPARAQYIEAHGTYIQGRDEQRPLSGFGVGAGKLFSVPHMYLGARAGLDYAREHGPGPGRWAGSLDLTLTPAMEDLRFVPYVGGSVSANQSGGDQAAWKGTRVGYDGIVGAILPVNLFGLLLEARYGYIAGLPHVFSGRAGLAIGF